MKTIKELRERVYEANVKLQEEETAKLKEDDTVPPLLLALIDANRLCGILFEKIEKLEYDIDYNYDDRN